MIEYRDETISLSTNRSGETSLKITKPKNENLRVNFPNNGDVYVKKPYSSPFTLLIDDIDYNTDKASIESSMELIFHDCGKSATSTGEYIESENLVVFKDTDRTHISSENGETAYRKPKLLLNNETVNIISFDYFFNPRSQSADNGIFFSNEDKTVITFITMEDIISSKQENIEVTLYAYYEKLFIYANNDLVYTVPFNPEGKYFFGLYVYDGYLEYNNLKIDYLNKTFEDNGTKTSHTDNFVKENVIVQREDYGTILTNGSDPLDDCDWAKIKPQCIGLVKSIELDGINLKVTKYTESDLTSISSLDNSPYKVDFDSDNLNLKVYTKRVTKNSDLVGLIKEISYDNDYLSITYLEHSDIKCEKGLDDKTWAEIVPKIKNKLIKFDSMKLVKETVPLDDMAWADVKKNLTNLKLCTDVVLKGINIECKYIDYNDIKNTTSVTDLNQFGEFVTNIEVIDGDKLKITKTSLTKNSDLINVLCNVVYSADNIDKLAWNEVVPIIKDKLVKYDSLKLEDITIPIEDMSWNDLKPILKDKVIKYDSVSLKTDKVPLNLKDWSVVKEDIKDIVFYTHSHAQEGENLGFYTFDYNDFKRYRDITEFGLIIGHVITNIQYIDGTLYITKKEVTNHSDLIGALCGVEIVNGTDLKCTYTTADDVDKTEIIKTYIDYETFKENELTGLNVLNNKALSNLSLTGSTLNKETKSVTSNSDLIGLIKKIIFDGSSLSTESFTSSDFTLSKKILRQELFTESELTSISVLNNAVSDAFINNGSLVKKKRVISKNSDIVGLIKDVSYADDKLYFNRVTNGDFGNKLILTKITENDLIDVPVTKIHLEYDNFTEAELTSISVLNNAVATASLVKGDLVKTKRTIIKNSDIIGLVKEATYNNGQLFTKSIVESDLIDPTTTNSSNDSLAYYYTETNPNNANEFCIYVTNNTEDDKTSNIDIYYNETSHTYSLKELGLDYKDSGILSIHFDKEKTYIFLNGQLKKEVTIVPPTNDYHIGFQFNTGLIYKNWNMGLNKEIFYDNGYSAETPNHNYCYENASFNHEQNYASLKCVLDNVTGVLYPSSNVSLKSPLWLIGDMSFDFKYHYDENKCEGHVVEFINELENNSVRVYLKELFDENPMDCTIKGTISNNELSISDGTHTIVKDIPFDIYSKRYYFRFLEKPIKTQIKPELRYTDLNIYNTLYKVPFKIKCRGFDDRGRVYCDNDLEVGLWQQTIPVEAFSSEHKAKAVFDNVPDEVKYLDFVLLFDEEIPVINLSRFMLYEGDYETSYTPDASKQILNNTIIPFKRNFYVNLYNEEDDFGLSISRPHMDSIGLINIPKSYHTILYPYIKNCKEEDNPQRIAIEYLKSIEQTINVDWNK